MAKGNDPYGALRSYGGGGSSKSARTNPSAALASYKSPKPPVDNSAFLAPPNGPSGTTPQDQTKKGGGIHIGNPLKILGHAVASIAKDVKDTTVGTWQGLGDVARGELAGRKVNQQTSYLQQRNKQWSDQFGKASDAQWKDPNFQARAKAFTAATKANMPQISQNTQQDLNTEQKVNAKKLAFQSGETALNIGTAGIGDLVVAPLKAGAKLGIKAAVKMAVKTGATDALEHTIAEGGQLAAEHAAAEAAKHVGEKAAKTLVQKTISSAAQNGLLGAGYGVAETGKNNPNATGKDFVKGAAIGGVGGAALGATIPIVGDKLHNLATRVVNGKTVADTTKLATRDLSDKSIFTKLPEVAKGDTKQSVLNRDFVTQQYHDLIKPVQKAAQGMSAKDVKLLESIESGKPLSEAEASVRVDALAKNADNPKQFKQVHDLMRDAYNTRLAGDVSLGRDVGFRHNYLPHMFDQGDAKTADTLAGIETKNAKLMSKGQPGYLKPRSVNTYAEADSLGLKRKNGNVLQDFYDSMNQAGYEHGAQALRNGLESAHPGEVAVGKIGTNVATGEKYKQLNIAGGSNFSLPEKLADEYNRRAAAGEAPGLLGAYDTANAGLKYAKLGGGTFHALTEAGNIAGQQLASLNLIKHPIENLRVIAGTLSRKAHAANWERLGSNAEHHTDQLSTLDRMKLSGVTMTPKEILADVNVGAIDKMKGSKLNFIKNVHDMIFGRQIPEGKALIFEQATKGLSSQVPEDLARMRDVASAVNNMGGINRAVDGLTPGTARKLSRVLLATDFTEGRYRIIGNAIARGGDKGRIARQMVVGKSIVFALPGLAALVVAGKLDPSDPKAVGDAFTKQILNPSIASNFRGKATKSNPGGTTKSIELPRTYVSEIAKVLMPALDPLSPDRTKGVKDYAHARLAALPATAEAVGTNQDFFGNPLYGHDKQGNPISPGKAAINIAGQGAPIPAVQASKMKQQTAAESILNTAGFRVATDPNSPEAQHSKAITDFYNTYNAAYTNRQKASKQITALVMAGKINEAKRRADEWNNSIYPQISGFKGQYKDNYNPAWDKEFVKLVIPTSGSAFKARVKSGELSQAVLR